MQNTEIMWTRQVSKVWEILQKDGFYYVRREYIENKNGAMADYYLKLYEWYTAEARKYIDIPTQLQYPIWLSLSEEKMLQPVEDTIILKLEVPRDKFIVCNMNNWGYRVNYWYVPLDAEDEERNKRELKRYGLSSEDDLMLTDKGNFYPMLRKKIKDSWARVLTDPPKNQQDAAATVWELHLEWVKEVQIYEKGQ